MTGRRHQASRSRIFRSGVLAGALAALGLIGCDVSDRDTDQPIVATVGSSSISKESFDRLSDLSRHTRPFDSSGDEFDLPTPRDILAELVKEVLLIQELETRGLSADGRKSPRDVLAADLGRGLDPTTADLERWFEANKLRFSRKAQLRFLNVTLPLENEHKAGDTSTGNFFALCEAADSAAAGTLQWGDIGWLQTGHAPWWPRTQWTPAAVGTTRLIDWPDGRRHLTRAMHFRPPAQFLFEQVVNHCRRGITTEAVQAEIRRILLRRAQGTSIVIVDERLDFELDPVSIVRTEPGPALETLDPALGDATTMVRIAGGAFTTGSTDAEIDERVRICRQYVEPALGEGSCARWNYEDEIQRRVTVESFFMDRTEVSWEDYQVFVEATRHRPLPEFWSGEPSFPVAHVSMEDAQSYCRWRGKRLPTAYEWEFAARGVEGRRYPWGNDSPDGTRANFCDINCPKPWHNFDHDDGFAGPAPIGSFPAGATPEGLLDMGGNLREWTATIEGEKADVKGGGFFNAIDDLIAADVRRNRLEVRDPTVGFRCVRDPQAHEPSGGQ